MVEWRLERCTSLSTPQCDEHERQEAGDEELDSNSATMFPRSVAMFHHMALDRSDLSVASKEVCSGTAKLSQKDVVQHKRTVRYLSQARRRCKYG